MKVLLLGFTIKISGLLRLEFLGYSTFSLKSLSLIFAALVLTRSYTEFDSDKFHMPDSRVFRSNFKGGEENIEQKPDLLVWKKPFDNAGH